MHAAGMVVSSLIAPRWVPNSRNDVAESLLRPGADGRKPQCTGVDFLERASVHALKEIDCARGHHTFCHLWRARRHVPAGNVHRPRNEGRTQNHFAEARYWTSILVALLNQTVGQPALLETRRRYHDDAQPGAPLAKSR